MICLYYSAFNNYDSNGIVMLMSQGDMDRSAPEPLEHLSGPAVQFDGRAAAPFAHYLDFPEAETLDTRPESFSQGFLGRKPGCK